MALNKGKQWEAKVKEDFSKLPYSTIDRIYDVTTGHKSISNISDFIGYKFPNIFYIEAKSIKGNTFPLTNLTQYDKLCAKVGIPGVRAGVILWAIEKKIVLYIPINTFTKIKAAGKKSFNLTKDLNSSDFPSILLPSSISRVFPTVDYTPLLSLPESW